MTPFSNSMEPDNEPSNEGDANAGANDNRPANGPTASSGSGVETSVSTGYPLPKDPHAPHGDDGDNDQQGIQEYGVVESRDVAHNASVHQYGITK